MLTMTQTQAHNKFNHLLATAIDEPVAITAQNNKTIYMFSDDNIQDMIDGLMASQAEKEGFLTVEESKNILDAFR